jgi:ribonuclease Z
MALATDILENLRGFSKAMYSTWIFYRPGHVLFDAGEGVATALGNFVYAVEKVFLSHGHYDHVGGITGFVLARAGAMGEKTKPLDIYYPGGDALVEMARDYVRRIARHVQFPLTWHPITPGDEIPLQAGNGAWSVRSFPTRHVRGMTTCGFVLQETRRRLRPALQGTPGPELARLRQAQGPDAVTEAYAHPLLAYTGDAMPCDPAHVQGATVLLHDATFLEATDRDVPTHATVGEALDVAMQAACTTCCLYHVSTRYRRREIEASIRAAVAARQCAFPVHLLHLNRLEALTGEGVTKDARGVPKRP